jgi:hypothetical protein
MIFTMPHRNFREALQFVTLHAYRLHPDLPRNLTGRRGTPSLKPERIRSGADG